MKNNRSYAYRLYRWTLLRSLNTFSCENDAPWIPCMYSKDGYHCDKPYGHDGGHVDWDVPIEEDGFTDM